MTTPAAVLKQPYQHATRASASPHTPQAAGAMHCGTRTYEVVSLRADGAIHIAQHKAPALPLFDSAFAAFTHGSLIQTTQGEVPIEDLQPGDMVMTVSGEALPALWIGSAGFVPADVGHRVPLTRIMADTFGQERPASFLTVGPAARILQTPPELRNEAGGRSMLTPAAAFEDGVNVIKVVPPTPVRMFHICLTRHASVRVGGLEMETFHPGSAALRSVTHAMRDQFLSLFPHIAHPSDFGPLAHPRAPETSGEELV